MTSVLEERLLTKIKKFDDEYPSAWIIDMSNKGVMKRYRLKESFGRDCGIEFYFDYVKKLLIPELASEMEETIYNNSDTLIKRLVGTNFNAKVFEEQYDAVIYFASSLDEVSNFLYLEVFEQVANKIVADKYVGSSVKFYKIDLALNEIEDLDISLSRAFPVIRVYSNSRGMRNPIDYDSTGKVHFNVVNIHRFILDNI